MEDSITMEDSYAVLGLKPGFDGPPFEDLRKAYRAKALICHPDKRPGDPLAAAQFQRLQRAYDILSDEGARKVYHDRLNIRLERETRVDFKRRKMSEDLRKRENPVKVQAEDTASKRLQAEIAKICAKGKGMEKMLKVSWLVGSDYSAARLKDIFAQFGRVEAIVLRKFSALVVMSSIDEALAATTHLLTNPLLVVVPLVAHGSFSSASPFRSQPRVSERSTPDLGSLVGNAFQNREDSVLQKMLMKAEQLKSNV